MRYAYISLLKFLVVLLISSHWFACLWVMVAELEPPDQTTWADELHASLRGDDDGGVLAARFAVGYASEEDAAAERAAYEAATACDDDERWCKPQIHHSLK
jgi:hypothetical protein